MQEKTGEIAARVREMRKIAGFTPGRLAERLGINEAAYTAWESGEQDIPASELWELARALGVDMTELLTGEAPRLSIYTVTRKDKGVAVERHHAYRYQALAPNLLHKKAEPFLVTVEPKAPGEGPPEGNRHPGQEFDYVLEGSLRVRIHDSVVDLAPGDSIFFDSSHAHAMEALEGAPARFLAVIL